MEKMKVLTIRNISSEVSDKLKLAAKKKGKSVNQYVVDLITQQIGISKQKKYTNQFDDLDHLFGKWSKSEYQQIQEKIDSERIIDSELWQ